MSSKNNVNPDHYKTAGRGRPGEKKGQSVDRAKYAQSKKQPDSGFLPGPSEQGGKNAGRPARQRANTRHGTNPSPAASPVSGEFGKQETLSETEESIVDTRPRENPEGDDFLEVRRKQNTRARK